MKFSDIPAHESVKEHLRRMADSHQIPHALLLEGPQGVGKFMLARAFAQYIHCEHPVNGDSCGVCDSCRQHQTFNQADTFYSFPILKPPSSPVTSDDFAKEFRAFVSDSPFMDFHKWLQLLGNPNGQPVIYSSESSALARKFSTTSYSSRYKILLQWLPERMQPDCANKLLKMIEEPQPDTLLIFVTDAPGEILPTIYSRLQRVRVNRLPLEEVAEYLQRNYPLDAADARSLAHLSEGSILKAQSLMAVADESRQYLELFKELMRKAYQRQVGALRKWSVDVAGLGREQIMGFLSYCERMMRENFIYNLQVEPLSYLTNEEKQFSSRFAPFINEANVEQLVYEFSSARADIAQNGNAKIILFDMAVHTILLLKH